MIDSPSLAKFAAFVELKDFRPPTKKEYVRYLRKLGEHYACDPAALSGRTSSERTGGAGTDARRRRRDGKAKGKDEADGEFDGRVQPRMERTLCATTPHFQTIIPSALRSFPSFGD